MSNARGSLLVMGDEYLNILMIYVECEFVEVLLKL